MASPGKALTLGASGDRGRLIEGIALNAFDHNDLLDDINEALGEGLYRANAIGAATVRLQSPQQQRRVQCGAASRR